MQHRDFIVLQKILSEISIGTDMLGDTTLTDFFDKHDYNQYRRIS